MSLTPEDIAAIATMLDAKIDSALASVLAPAATTPPEPVEQFDAALLQGSDTLVTVGAGKRTVPTPEQLARDASDPGASIYTQLVRESYDMRTTGKFHALYVPIWTAEKARLVSLGVPQPGKAAQANFMARLKLERERLAQRDAGTQVHKSTSVLVDSDRIRSRGTHGDPTANTAITNVDRAAALRAELALLENPAPVTPSTRSVAAKARGSNPYEATIAKVVREARASDNPGQHVMTWLKASLNLSPSGKTRYQGQARIALSRLGIAIPS